MPGRSSTNESNTLKALFKFMQTLIYRGSFLITISVPYKHLCIIILLYQNRTTYIVRRGYFNHDGWRHTVLWNNSGHFIYQKRYLIVTPSRVSRSSPPIRSKLGLTNMRRELSKAFVPRSTCFTHVQKRHTILMHSFVFIFS